MARGSASVTDTVTTIFSGDSWSYIILQNVGDDPVYVQVTPENNALTVSNGLKLYPGSSMAVDLNESAGFAASSTIAGFGRGSIQQGPIQAIADSGKTVDVRYIIG